MLAPDGTAVGDTDGRTRRRTTSAAAPLDARGAPAGPRVHRAAAPGRADGLPRVRGTGGRAGRRAMALGTDDFVFPTFRELAAALVRGVDPVQYLAYHRGTWHGGPYDPRATRFGPICIPVATQIPHAVGYAMGLQLDGFGRARSPTSGTAARARGTSTRRANLAGVFGAPVSCSARTTDGRSACRPRDSRPARSGGEPRATGSRAFASTATTCSRCTGRPGRRPSVRTRVKARP